MDVIFLSNHNPNHIDDSLEVPFREIEKIISMVHNPIKVRRAIADRFSLVVPEELNEHINDYIIHGRKRSSRESSVVTSSTPSTPILNKKKKRFF
jgi:hypothetical protein